MVHSAAAAAMGSRPCRGNRLCCRNAATQMLLTLLFASAIVAGVQSHGDDLQCSASSPCDLMCSRTCSDKDIQISVASLLDAAEPWPMQAGFAGVVATDNSASTSYRSLKASGGSTMRGIIARVTAVAEQQAVKSMQQLHPAQYPLATLPDGGWQVKEAGDWTSGFFPGILWQLHGLTGKQMWADKARQWQAGLANQQLDWIAQHDLGRHTKHSMRLSWLYALADDCNHSIQT